MIQSVASGTPLKLTSTRRRGITVTSSGGGASTYAAAVLADSPALYWRLGESVGPTAADASGNAHPGTYGTGVTFGVAGGTTDGNTAVALDGTANGRITSSYAPFVAGASLTVEGIFKRTSTAGNDVLFTAATGANSPYLRIAAGGSNVNFDPDVTAAGASVTWAAAWPGTGTFVHWALTFNDTTNVAELFINGISQGTTAPADPFNTLGGFCIGPDQFGNSGVGLLGSIDEPAVYTSILSAARILAHQNAR